MSRFYDSRLNHPVTILEVDNCKIIEVKTLEKHGYKSFDYHQVLLKSKQTIKRIFKKNNTGSFKISKEFTVSEPEQ